MNECPYRRVTIPAAFLDLLLRKRSRNRHSEERSEVRISLLNRTKRDGHASLAMTATGTAFSFSNYRLRRSGARDVFTWSFLALFSDFVKYFAIQSVNPLFPLFSPRCVGGLRVANRGCSVELLRSAKLR